MTVETRLLTAGKQVSGIYPITCQRLISSIIFFCFLFLLTSSCALAERGRGPRGKKIGINFHRHQLPVVTALNTPLDIEHSSWRCVRSKVGRRLVRRCQEVYFFLSSLRDSPSTYTHRYETTQREVRKRWCGGLWKVIRKVSNLLTFHLQIGYLGLLGLILFILYRRDQGGTRWDKRIP